MNRWIVFFELIKQDLIIFKRECVTKYIDTIILFITNVVGFGYFMQLEGATEGYAAFFAIGAIASFGFIDIVAKVALRLADIYGERTINHILAMPISSSMFFYYIGISWAMSSILLSAPLFIIGKLLVFKQLTLSALSIPKLITIFVTANLFFGFFAFWLTGIMKGMTNLSSLWLRYIAPMWLLGGYTYSWESLMQMSHPLGYISLINPMIYVMEGMRAAVLGQEGYLPFWLTLVMLWLFIFICKTHGSFCLKRKLDCL